MNKRDKAEKLYIAMSEIDDMFVHEAMVYKKTQTYASFFRKLSPVLCAIFLITVSVLLINSIRDSANQTPDKDYVSLSETLLAADGKTYSDSSQIDLFDGYTKLILLDEGNYKVIELSADANTILRNLSGNQTNYEVSPELKLWLSDGQGRVISPYLELSAGNIGYNELFDYNPELDISPAFSEYLKRLI